MQARSQKPYPLNQSPLYCLKSKRKLAAALGVPLRDLQFLVSLDKDNYKQFDTKEKLRDKLAAIGGHKARKIQQPKPLLASIHKRIARLLSRIQKPSYVYSATKGLSYLDNAKHHQNDEEAVKVDVKEFYQSLKAGEVRNFFESEMRCSPDVAHFLSKICCFGGALPTGSALSPSLSYFACSAMFRRIAAYAEARGLKFSLYVDDMVFSGPGADRAFARVVVAELKRHHLVGHKISVFGTGDPKVITGAVVRASGVAMPFKRQKRIRLFERAFWRADDPEHVRVLGTTLIGQYREGERLQLGSKLRARIIKQRMDAYATRFPRVTSAPPQRSRSAVHRSPAAFNSLRERTSKGFSKEAAGLQPIPVGAEPEID